MISLSVNDVMVSHKVNRFSDGAIGVKIVNAMPVKVERAGILVKSEGNLNDEFFEIASLVDILRACNSRVVITLFLPFAPYARQDRRMDRHDAFSLKVYADQINLLNLDRVVVLDSHSDGFPACVNNCVNIPQDFILRASKDAVGLSDFAETIISPDAGSAKKVIKAAIALGVDPNSVVYLEKIRDTTTGAITSTKIASDPSGVMGTNCLIIDDLCDGGATFIAGAEVLYKAGARSVGLFVTHGIFSRGVLSLSENGIDKIWTTDSFLCKTREGTSYRGVVETISVNSIFNMYLQGF